MLSTNLRRIIRKAGFVAKCGLVVLCSYTVMASTWTDRPEKVAYKSRGLVILEPNFPDWRSCQEACVAADDCFMFIWNGVDNECKLAPDGYRGLAHGVLTQGTTGHIVGQIDEAGSLVWLGVGDETLAWYKLEQGSLGPLATLEDCRQLCDANDLVIPCLSVSLNYRKNITCCLGSGYYDLSQMARNNFWAALTKEPDVPDPTGFGTRITAGKLPPAPAPLKGAAAPYTVMTKRPVAFGNPAGTVFLQSGNDVDNVAQCASLCHDNVNCHSFTYGFALSKDKCNLFDYAIKGVLISTDHRYGIINRDGPPGNIESLVVSDSSPLPSVLSSTTAADVDACAKLCYEHHEPFYCTMFQYDGDQCNLYCVDYLHELSSAEFETPPSGTVVGRIDDGRRAFHQPTDNGDPLPASPPKHKLYRFNANIGRNGTAAREVIALGSGSDGNQELLCATECFARRKWCRGVSVDMAANICRLYETKVGRSDQLVQEAGSSYAV